MNNKETAKRSEMDEVFEKLSKLLPTLATNLTIDTRTLNKLKNIFVQHPEIFEAQGRDGKTIGMLAAEFGIEWIVSMSLNDANSRLIQDVNGRTTAMYAVKFGLWGAVNKVLELKDVQAGRIQDDRGYTFAMYLVEAKRDREASKAISQDLEAGTLVDNCWNENVGMMAARFGLPKALSEALRNPKARDQKDKMGRTMVTIANGNGMGYVVNNFWALKELSNVVKEVEKSLGKK